MNLTNKDMASKLKKWRMTSSRKRILCPKQCLVCAEYWQDGKINMVVSTIVFLMPMLELPSPPQVDPQIKEKTKK